ncbi:WD40/YVTN/BNR-like repeat-containing protein [Arenimonas daejeonensis]|uniref:WD40/YVTN/BNR-like repeat-containing protein n=1 Tax=Arenimonas daejeonensis TaxID=370777 RepID=UPI0011BF718E|nr:sialidase family protein [Arenimonas daejeonensis]
MTDTLLVSTRKGLFVLRRGRVGWETEHVAFLGDKVALSLADPRDGAWYAALDLGHFGAKLQRSDDRGRTWTELAVPAYGPDDSVATGDGKPPKPATLELIWSLEAGDADQPGRLWAGTLPGGLFRSDDRGASWQLMRGLWDQPSRSGWFGGGYDSPGIHSICVDPRDPRCIRIAVSCGGVWRSDDDGATWRVTSDGMFAEYMPEDRRFDPVIQDPHRMVQCAAAPDTLWVQHHNGVFRSDDGGARWHEVATVKPSVFGFAVGVHPREPGTAWFVPAIKDERRVPVDGRLVVARTRDGGANFDVLSEGLPHDPAYDLVYRHGLAVDGSGDQVAIGSTTGGLWISEDQGDCWMAPALRLPPIHALTFA